MKKQSDAWVYLSPNSINLSWYNTPFVITSLNRLRAIFLHIEIHSKKIKYGSTHTITYLYNSKVSFTESTKWKWTGGINSFYDFQFET